MGDNDSSEGRVRGHSQPCHPVLASVDGIGGSAKPPTMRITPSRLLRNIRLVLLAGVVVYAGWQLLYVGVPVVCSDQVTASGQVVRVCSDMELNDPRAVYFLVVVAFLLLPEVGELQVANLLSVKRHPTQDGTRGDRVRK